MKAIKETLKPEQVLGEQEETSTWIEKARIEVELLRRRLDRLAKLQSLLKEKYYSRLDSLFVQLRDIDMQQWELRSLAKQLKGNGKRQSINKEQIATLERGKKTVIEVIKQIFRYRKSSNAVAKVIEEERGILFQRVNDLEHTLELIEQAELDEKESKIVSQRIYATKRLLEDHEIDLSKRTMDLLFEFYIPSGSNHRLQL
jgi:hypothetical protein